MARGPFPWGRFRKAPLVQTRFSHLHMKYLFFSWLTVFVGSWIVYVEYSLYTELCRGHDCKNSICERYRRGMIAGSACQSLCEKDTLQLRKCLSVQPHSQVYAGSWGDLEGVLKCHMDEALHYNLGEEKLTAAFNKLTKRTSVEKFNEMILNHLKTKVGNQPSISDLASQVLFIADANKDSYISLPEARTIWALLHRNDFILTLFLQDREHMPKLLGFCGDLYMIEKVPYSPLYGISLPWLIELWIPASVRHSMDQWFTPSWPHKAKISIGLLELVEDIFHGTFGSFLMCDVSAFSFGYTNRHDLKVTNSRHIVPEIGFQEIMRQQHCNVDEDCLYGTDCLTSCDLTKHRCTSEVVKPNLAKACGALKDYILSGAPSDINEELEKQLYACIALKGTTEQMEIEHSLILNNLKTLLWKKISHIKDS